MSHKCIVSYFNKDLVISNNSCTAVLNKHYLDTVGGNSASPDLSFKVLIMVKLKILWWKIIIIIIKEFLWVKLEVGFFSLTLLLLGYCCVKLIVLQSSVIIMRNA